MGGKITRRQELTRSKKRARLLATQFDLTVRRDRRLGSLVLGGLRRRPVSVVAASAGILAWFLLRRATSASRR